MESSEFKKKVSRNSKGSTRFVKAEKYRECYICGGKITKGQECLELNVKTKGRIYECMSCVDIELQLQEINSDLNKCRVEDSWYTDLLDYKVSITEV